MNKYAREKHRAMLHEWTKDHIWITRDEAGTIVGIVPSMAWDKTIPVWIPEEGSEAWDRMNGVETTGKYELKAHWNGSTMCGCVVGPDRWRHSGRIFRGDEFDGISEHKRCKTCNDDFNRG